jgi:hypothetical protein
MILKLCFIFIFHLYFLAVCIYYFIILFWFLFLFYLHFNFHYYCYLYFPLIPPRCKSIFSSFRGAAARKVGPVCFDGQISQPLVTKITLFARDCANQSPNGRPQLPKTREKIISWAKKILSGGGVFHSETDSRNRAQIKLSSSPEAAKSVHQSKRDQLCVRQLL